MSATIIVALFSFLSACSAGAHGSVGGLLTMLSVMRCAVFESYDADYSDTPLSFFLGIGVGAEYPCGSVSASEQSEEPAISKKAQNRWFALATSMCTVNFFTPFESDCYCNRHNDRLWIRHCCLRPSSSPLDVSKVDYKYIKSADLSN